MKRAGFKSLPSYQLCFKQLFDRIFTTSWLDVLHTTAFDLKAAPGYLKALRRNAMHCMCIPAKKSAADWSAWFHLSRGSTCAPLVSNKVDLRVETTVVLKRFTFFPLNVRSKGKLSSFVRGLARDKDASAGRCLPTGLEFTSQNTSLPGPTATKFVPLPHSELFLVTRARVCTPWGSRFGSSGNPLGVQNRAWGDRMEWDGPVGN